MNWKTKFTKRNDARRRGVWLFSKITVLLFGVFFRSLSHFVLFIFNVSRLQLQFMRWLSHHDLWNEINWIAIKFLHGIVITQVSTNAFCYESLNIIIHLMCLIKIDFEKDLMKSPHEKVIEYFVKYVGIYPDGVIWGNAILKTFNWKVRFHNYSIY